jgi:hypothetical protein
MVLLWTKKQRQRATEIEMEIESEFLCATPFGLDAVRRARDHSVSVAFVSDMYLCSHFITLILKREGVARAGDLIAVSGEWKASKAKEKIWPLLMSKLEIAPENLFHQGDHPESDIESPSKFGIKSRRLGTSVVSRWERWCPHHSVLSTEEWGGIAALSRITRNSCEEPDNYWTQLGSGVIGPILTGFVTWLLDLAERDGMKTLWFLSRDGWLFYQAARHLNRNNNLQLEYVGINRLHLRCALDEKLSLDQLFSDSRSITWLLVAERLCLGTNELDELQKSVGIECSIYTSITSDVQRRLLLTLESPKWKEICESKVRLLGSNANSYLRQCLNESAGEIGLVDVGWVGRIQDGLSVLSPKIKRGYYLGLSKSVKLEKSKSAWLYDRRSGQGACSLDSFQRMIEVLIGREIGPLLGYDCNDEKWHPRFATSEKVEIALGRNRVHSAALSFVQLSADPAFSTWWSSQSMKSFASSNLTSLFEQPSHLDAREFLPWRITTDDAHQDAIQPARGFNRSRILACLYGKEPWGMIWPQAALRNSDTISRFFMKAACRWQLLRQGS